MRKVLTVFAIQLVAVMPIVAKPGPKQITKITGKIVAFDPVLHISSALTSVKNREIIIVETIIKNNMEYMIIVVERMGDSPLPNNLFDGKTSFSLNISKKPLKPSVAVDFWREGEFSDVSGKFRFTSKYSGFDEDKLKKMALRYFTWVAQPAWGRY